MLRRDVLQQEARGARLDRRIDVLVEVERRQDHDPWRLAGLLWIDQASRRPEPVKPGHADVHQDHVRAAEAGEVDRAFAVSRLGDDLDVGLRVEDHPEAAAHERLVVGDRDADHDAGSRSAASCSDAATSQPPT